MAIQFARIGHVQRSAGAKACCKGAYNARAIIKDEKTKIIEIDKLNNLYEIKDMKFTFVLMVKK